MPSRGRFDTSNTLTLAAAAVALWIGYGTCRVVAQPAEEPAWPTLPRAFVDTSYTPPVGKTFRVRAGADPQAAFDAAQPGDVISLEAGAVFRGNFILPRKSGSAWIVIRSSSPEIALPAPGTRVTPAASQAMPKLVSPNDSPAVQAAPGAHHYRFIGVEFTVADNVTRISSIVAFGGRHTSPADIPYNLILDRCFVHGHVKLAAFQGVLLNSASSAVIDSYVSEIHVNGRDSQAVLGYNGPGPFKIVNNYLEAAGENIMFGGIDPAIVNLVPSDIEISGNHLFKPLSWNPADPSYAGTPWTRKTILELKNAQRVLIEGNLLENMLGEKGSAMVLTPRNQGNTAPWSVVQDITFRHNIVRNAAVGWKAQGTDDGFPSQQMHRVAILNNLWLRIGLSFFYLSGPIDDLVIDHNTALPLAHSAYHIEGIPPLKRFRLSNNIMGLGTHGLQFSRLGDSKWVPAAFVSNNAVIGPGDARRPQGSTSSSASPAFRLFMTAASAGLRGDGSLNGGSPLRDASSHGRDIGVSFPDLDQALRSTSPRQGR